MGGLGNQLFIYAAGLTFESITRRPIKFDALDVMGSNRTHSSGMLNFANPRRIIQNPLLLQGRRGAVWLLHRISALLSLRPVDYRSHVLGFDEKMVLQDQAWSVRGHFQSYRYAIEDSVLQELNNLRPCKPSEKFLKELKNVGKELTLSIHVRRGDYVELKDKFGLLSKVYFETASEQALAVSNRKIKRVLLFSDDIPEAKKLMEGINFGTIPISTVEGLSDEEELFLMAQSDLLIISNSTFSWWAAKLGTRPKIVFAPDKWFKSMKDPEHIYPEDWKKVVSRWA